VNALLRQPGGFEGIFPVHIGDAAQHLSVSKGPQVRFVLGDLNAAALASAHGSGKDDDLLTGVEELECLGIEAPFVPSGRKVTPKLRPASVTLIARRGVEICPSGPQFQIVVGELLEEPRPITERIVLSEPIVSPAHDLDVLLRHRPRSIAGLRPGGQPLCAISLGTAEVADGARESRFMGEL
jgi:hypothetical protein